MAGDSIGGVYLDVIGDLTPFKKQLATDVPKAAGAAGTAAGKTMSTGLLGGIKGQLADFRKQGGIPGALMGGVGLGAGLGLFNLVTGGISAVTDVLGDAGRAASDLNETESKLSAVFPAQAAAIRAWAATASSSMGLSKQAALEAAGTFGNFLEAMGQTEPVAADMSKTMVQLAADLGSFNNASPEDVLLALRSGLSGETEPLRQFGVDISDAAVQAELLNSGLKKVGGQFTTAQKIQGRYNLIMRQTVRAQDDFARTASGTANATKTQAAQMEDLKAKVGGIVNTVVNATVVLGTGLVQGLSNAADAVGGLGEAFHDLARFIDPAMALIEDTDTALARLATGQGLSAQAVEEYAAAQEKATQAQADYNAQQAEIQRVARANLGLIGDLTAEQQAAVDAWIKSAEGVAILTDELDDMTQAQEQNLTATELAQQKLDQYRSAVDLATRTGLGLPAMLDEINTRMQKLGITWVQALGMVGQEVNEGVFRPMGTAAADAFTMSYLDGVNAAWGGEQVKTAITKAVAAPFDDALPRISESFADLAGDIEFTQERIRNKSGKGWHWKKDISTQLTALKHQFSTDIHRIDYLLKHPGQEGGQKTESELRKELRLLDERRQHALDDKNWVAYGAILAKTQDVNDELDKLNGRKVYFTVLMNMDIGRAFVAEHPGFNVHAIPRLASGLPYVPYDDFPALLHKGERVMTAEQNRGGISRVDFYVHDPDGGLARAGISTRALADAMRRWEDGP